MPEVMSNFQPGTRTLRRGAPPGSRASLAISSTERHSIRMTPGRNFLTAIRRRLRQAVQAEPSPFHDLRYTAADAIEAYYEKNGRPCIIDVALDECRWLGASGLSYSPDSLHPYVRTLVDYEERRHTTYEGSYLSRYWRTWRPPDLASYLCLDPRACHPLLVHTPPLHAVLPWSPADRIAYMKEERWMLRSDYRALLEAGASPARSCGPKPGWFGAARFDRLVSVYESIKADGYRLRKNLRRPGGETDIVVNCLVRNNEPRFLIADGQHRASALAVLGYRTVPAIVFWSAGRGSVMIRREEVEHWPLVRRGVFARTQALSVFDRIFDAVPPDEIRSSDLAAPQRE